MRIDHPQAPHLGAASPREPHLSATLARLVFELAHSRGVNAAVVSVAAGLPPLCADDPSARIPASSLSSLLDAAGRLLDDPHVGLHAGQCADAGRLGLFGLLQQTAASARALGPVLRRFSRLLHDECVLELREHDGQAFVTYRSSEAGPRHSVELVVTALVVCARRAWPDCPLRAVQFTHAAPSGSDEHAAVFGVPVQFGAPSSGYALASEYLDRPAAGADVGSHAALIEHAQRVLDSIDFVAAVRHAVARGLLLGQSGAPWVASELGISSRTLHRRLQAKHASYSGIVDDERSHRARTQLRERERVADIAHKLGFASPGAFRKAFKRWTGVTPSDFKQRGLVSGC
jgi:AraC-like DNA-binding protein